MYGFHYLLIFSDSGVDYSDLMSLNLNITAFILSSESHLILISIQSKSHICRLRILVVWIFMTIKFASAL